MKFKGIVTETDLAERGKAKVIVALESIEQAELVFDLFRQKRVVVIDISDSSPKNRRTASK